MGGVSSGRDALEFVAAGAADVALGTVLFSDPGAADRIRAELDAELMSLGVDGIDNAIGLAHAVPTGIFTAAGRPSTVSA
jgi:dihydroorotate dehydrogenase (NAD+) catalytic subunit